MAIDEIDPYQDALNQLHAYDLQVDSLDTSGKLTRCKTKDDKGTKKSGWYVAHEFNLSSGRLVITGRFGNWKASNDSVAFEFDATFTEEEIAAFREQQEKQRRAAAKEKRDRNNQATERANKIWPTLPTNGNSPYLAKKQINSFNARFGKNHSLAIPVTRAGALVGLQWIDAEGGKKYLTGTDKKGAYSFIAGDPENKTDAVVLCEGWATGCSIRMATGLDVVVCFDAGNLVHVAADMVARCEGSERKIIIAADNDHNKPPNKGLQVARQIQQAHGERVRVVWPWFPDDDPGTDFNDKHIDQGLDAVRNTIVSAQPQAFPDSVENSIKSPEQPPAGGVSGAPDDPDWQSKLARSKKKDGTPGGILGWSSNIALIFEHDETFRRALSYCDFSYRIIKRREVMPQMAEGEWIDSDTSAAMIWMARSYGFEPSDPKLAHALVNVAKHNRFHPVRDYLNGLEWDGVNRLDHWLSDVYESPADSAYLSAAGRKFMIGAVARIFRPGCKMDNVLILEGRQGLQKSTSVHRLFGDWFSDAPIPLGDKDSYQNIQGIWCHELAELDSFNKAESTTAKNFFTQTRDRYRPSYGHRAEDFPRQTVFVGTTNQDEYLKDYTGNRRYWPVKCQAVNLQSIVENRDQYWAEAVHRFKANEIWWVSTDAERTLFEKEQDSRLQIDPWQYHIEDYLNTKTLDFVTSAELLAEAIKKPAGQVTKADQNRVSPIMKAIGWRHVKKRVPVDGKKLPRWVYERPNA